MFSVAKSLIKCRNVQMYLCVYLCHIYIRFHLEIYFSLYVSKGVLKDKLKSQNLLTLIWLFFFSWYLETNSTKKPAIFSAFSMGKKKAFYIFHSNRGILSMDANTIIQQSNTAVADFFCLLLFKLLMSWLQYTLPVAAWWNTWVKYSITLLLFSKHRVRMWLLPTRVIKSEGMV